MTDLDLYISRKPAEKLLDKFGRALKQPESNPLVFYAYGIGGIGKSTLLEKLRETYAKEAKFARAFFGPTSKIDSPLALMEHLYKQLPDDGWGGDKFIELCRKYKETLHQLETEPVEGRGSASPEQVSLVKKLFGGAVKAAASWLMPDQAAEQLGSAAEGVVDVASLALSEKDRIEQFLKQHRATKNKRELQELMLDPLPKLTQAFAEGVIQKSRQEPIVLVLDTYEKASSEFDAFLCKYLLGDTALQSYPVRIVMAGRYSLKSKRYQRMFLQHWNLIYECQLEKFDKEETKQYLKEIGIVQPKEVRRVTQATKGFPYFLRLIKDQQENGRSLNTLRDSDEIVDRLLDGLTPIQRRVVQLASYCRWFDRPLIQYLVNVALTDNNQSTEEQIDWFDWLIERDFVISEDNYRVDDVARDVIRAAEHRADEQNFRHVHDLLAQYFQQLANQQVTLDQPAPARHENSDWRKYAAEATYHALFANRDRGQFQLLTYFFEGAHLKQPDVALTAFTAIAAEAEPTSNYLLPKDTQRFLDNVQVAVILGWIVVYKDFNLDKFNIENLGATKETRNGLIDSQIESSLGYCLQKIDHLTGLAKYVGLMGKIRRCYPSERIELIQRVREEAEKIETLFYPEFSSDLFVSIGDVLFLDIGDAFDELEINQEALNSYEKAIKLNSKNYWAWAMRGLVLDELKRYKEALKSYAKASGIKPNCPLIWEAQGLLLESLERYEEALSSYDKAIKLKPGDHRAWNNRGNLLEKLERYEEALSSYDKAIELKPDNYGAWADRSNVLRLLRRYDEAITSIDKALQITKSDADVWNARGLCLSFLKQYDEAINNIKRVRDLLKDNPLPLANLGIVLARAGHYEEAFDLCEQALKLKEDESGYYAKACCYALLGHAELAIKVLGQAIEYAPHRCRLEAKYNPDFDFLRANEQFQSLIENKPK